MYVVRANDSETFVLESQLCSSYIGQLIYIYL